VAGEPPTSDAELPTGPLDPVGARVRRAHAS